MTPDAERAREIVKQIQQDAAALDDASWVRAFEVLPDRIENALLAFAAAVRDEATRAERERCVSAACEYVNWTFNTDGLRAAIRGQEG